MPITVNTTVEDERYGTDAPYRMLWREGQHHRANIEAKWHKRTQQTCDVQPMQIVGHKNSNSDFSAIKVDLPGPERSAMLVHDSGIEFGRQDRAWTFDPSMQGVLF